MHEIDDVAASRRGHDSLGMEFVSAGCLYSVAAAGIFRDDRAHDCVHGWNQARYVSQGPLLDGESLPWLESYRHKYKLMCSQALTRMMQLDIDCGTCEDLLESAYQTLRLDPYNQLATRVIVGAFVRNGNYSRAERRLKAFCGAVQHDLGMRPPKEFVELRHRLLARTTP
ncbi:MAG: bacterial transcriptional activator domain-containing protein [Trebonia sp.]